MKILQISDLHIGNWLNLVDEDKNLEDLIDKIIAKWGSDKDKPVILVTGDITESGTKKQYELARDIFKKLKKKFKVYFVPGNHDYGFKGNIATRKRFKRFKKYLFGLDRISYPIVNTVENKNYNVTFIGLNSMKGECTRWERFLADGELGTSQLEELEGILDDIEDAEVYEKKKYFKVVYLHHHPFIFPKDKKNAIKLAVEKLTHALDDGEDLMNQISNRRIDALLFGHDHDHINFDKKVKGQERQTLVYDISQILSCGKSTKKLNGSYPTWLLEIDDQGKITVKDPKLK